MYKLYLGDNFFILSWGSPVWKFWQIYWVTNFFFKYFLKY